MGIDFADGVKSFHNLNLREDFGDWAGHVEGNWKGKITALR